jgi:hypothetical protein
VQISEERKEAMRASWQVAAFHFGFGMRLDIPKVKTVEMK